MDVLETVRTLRSEARDPSAEELASALARLEQAYAAEPQGRRRRRGVAWAGTAAAIVAAAALVIASVVGIGPVTSQEHRDGPRLHLGTSVPPADASAVLDDAAKLAGHTAPSALTVGHYLRVTTESAQLITWNPTPSLIGRENSTASWIRHTTQIVYVPADQTATWVVVDGAAPATISGKSGTDVDAAISRWQAANPDADAEQVRYLQGGISPSAAADHHPIRYGSPAVDLSTVPTDPATFLNWYRAELFPAGATDGDGFVESTEVGGIVGMLKDNALPPTLRSTLFKALGLIPGGTMVDTTGTTSTLQLLGHDLYRVQIDTATGMVVSSQVYFDQPAALTRALGAVPAGVPDVSETVTTTTVGSLPAALEAGAAESGTR
jgi:hypothetical protein